MYHASTRRSQRYGEDFDASKDLLIWEKMVDGDRGQIAVRIKSYDGGKPKLALERPGDKDRFFKLGRLSYDELARLLPVLDAAQTVLLNETSHWFGRHPPKVEPVKVEEQPKKQRRLAALGVR